MHIAIPPPHADTEQLTPKDYQIKEVIMGKPKVHTTKVMISMRMKEVFRCVDQDESKLIALWKYNKL